MIILSHIVGFSCCSSNVLLHALLSGLWSLMIWAVTCEFQQFNILTSVDSEEHVQPRFKLRNSKWCSVSSLTFIEFASDWKRLWPDCAYVQADLRLYWLHIPHCWKFHVTDHLLLFKQALFLSFFSFSLYCQTLFLVLSTDVLCTLRVAGWKTTSNHI